MEKLILFVEIHQLKEKGFSKLATANKLGISRNTVKKYWNMSFEEANAWSVSLKTRSKKLDPYQGKILKWLIEHPDMNSSQVEDWLKEQNPDLKIAGSTVRNYVSDLRDKYHIPKEVHVRSFEAVEELPMGEQAQVDWGEITLKNTDGKNVNYTLLLLFYLTQDTNM